MNKKNDNDSLFCSFCGKNELAACYWTRSPSSRRKSQPVPGAQAAADGGRDSGDGELADAPARRRGGVVHPGGADLPPPRREIRREMNIFKN